MVKPGLVMIGIWLGFVLMVGVSLDLVTWVFGKPSRGVGYGIGVVYLAGVVGALGLMGLALAVRLPRRGREVLVMGGVVIVGTTLWLSPNPEIAARVVLVGLVGGSYLVCGWGMIVFCRRFGVVRS